MHYNKKNKQATAQQRSTVRYCQTKAHLFKREKKLDVMPKSFNDKGI
jgi:hypothetical protein